MHRAAPTLYRQTVAHLMQCLQQRIGHDDDGDIPWRERLVGDIRQQFGGMQQGEPDATADNRQPQQQAQGREQQTRQRQKGIQHPIRVEQRNAQREGRGYELEGLLALRLLMAAQQLIGFRRDIQRN